MSGSREVVRFFQGWVEMLEKDAKGKVGVENIWMVMKGENIFLFTHQTIRSDETSRGYLPINSKTKFERKTKEDKKFGGYVFEIHAEKDTNTRSQKFKVSKKSDLEILRGYVFAISQGRIPKDLDLPLSTKDEMKSKVDYHINMKEGNFEDYLEPVDKGRIRRQSDPTILEPETSPSSRSVLDSRRHTMPELNTGNECPICGKDIKKDKVPVSYCTTCKGEILDFVLYRVYNQELEDKLILKALGKSYSDDVSTKSWFFPNTDREKAKEIFQKAGCKCGNTLLRGNSSSTADDRYAITICTGLGSDKQPVLTHFQVTKAEGGYRINVDECNEVIANLSEVMDVFSRINGEEKTYPMQTNDLVELGIESASDEDNYTRHISKKNKPISQVLEEPLPDYDDENSGDVNVTSSPSDANNTSSLAGQPAQTSSQHSLGEFISQLKVPIPDDNGDVPLAQAPPPPPPLLPPLPPLPPLPQ